MVANKMSDAPEKQSGQQVGLENLGALRQAVQTARFTQKERVIVQAGEILAGVADVRREMQAGQLSGALRTVDRLSAAFDQKAAQWERHASAKEQELQRSPGSMSMGDVSKMRSEHTRVRRDYRLAQTKFRRLRNELDQLEMAAQRQAAAEDNEDGESTPT